MACVENSVYNPDMLLDVATCQNPDALYLTSSGFGEGCTCIEGYIWDGGSCVKYDQCGCVLNEYPYYILVLLYKHTRLTKYIRLL